MFTVWIRKKIILREVCIISPNRNTWIACLEESTHTLTRQNVLAAVALVFLIALRLALHTKDRCHEVNTFCQASIQKPILNVGRTLNKATTNFLFHGNIALEELDRRLVSISTVYLAEYSYKCFPLDLE